jgi:hypothetical protein
VDSLQCPLCDGGTKTLEHLFIECSLARIAWSMSPWPIRFDLLNFGSIVDWIKAIINPISVLGIQKKEVNQFILNVVVVCDLLWMKRNEVNRNQCSPDPLETAIQIKQVVIQHYQAWDYKVFDRGKQVGWSPPFPSNVKVNYDAAIGSNGAFLAAVCGDHNSKIISIWTEYCDCFSPMIAAARAALLTVKRMKEAGFTNVIFEGDSLVVAHAIQGILEAQYWSIYCIINDILSLLPFFSFWLVSHVYRDFNTTTHYHNLFLPLGFSRVSARETR